MTYIILLIAQAFYFDNDTHDSKTDHWTYQLISIIFHHVGTILDNYLVHILLLCTFQPLIIFLFDRNQQHPRRYKWHSHKPARHRRKFNLAPLLAYSVVAYAATDTKYSNYIKVDTDSAPVGIDNRCSACISHRIEDFQGPVVACNRSIKGFGGTRTRNVQKGTIQWNWLDNEGTVHKFTIPNSYYVPDGNVRLLSPQHWAKTQGSKVKASETTDATSCTLSWGNQRYNLTVPMDHNNVATFHLAPGYTKFHAFCAEAEITEDYAITCEAANVISDDEDETDWQPATAPPKEPPTNTIV